MDNPITRARKRAGRTLVEFGEDCNTHEQAIYLNECGVYPTILPAVLDHMVSLGYDRDVVSKEYVEFVRRKRIKVSRDLELAFFNLKEPSQTTHPFVSFRKQLGMSRMGFAKNFCVHPAVLYTLEKGQSQHLPGQVREAILAVGVPATVIEELDYQTQEWAERGKESIREAS